MATYSELVKETKEKLLFDLKDQIITKCNPKIWNEKRAEMLINLWGNKINPMKDYEDLLNTFVTLYKRVTKNKETNPEQLEKDFHEFYSETYHKKIKEQKTLVNELSKNKTNWFKGIRDSLKGEKDAKLFMKSDAYFKGHQKGEEILRGLILQAEELFPIPKGFDNLFVDNLKKMSEILFNAGMYDSDLEKVGELQKIVWEQKMKSDLDKRNNRDNEEKK